MKVNEQIKANNNKENVKEKNKDELKLLLKLNYIAYSANEVESIESLEVKEPLGNYKLVDATCNYPNLQHNGLKLAVFYNENTNNIVIACAGTEPDDIKDLTDDLRLLYGGQTTKFEDLKSFLELSLKKLKLNITNISVTGHSLGCVIADLANAELRARGYKTEAILFESPGTKHVVINAFSKILDAKQLEQIKPVTYNSKPNIINNGNVFSDSDSPKHRGDIFVIPTATAKISTQINLVTFKNNPKDKNKVNNSEASSELAKITFNSIYKQLNDFTLNLYRKLKLFYRKVMNVLEFYEGATHASHEIGNINTKYGLIGLNNIYKQINNVKEHGIDAIYNNLENGSNHYKVVYGYNYKENGSPSVEIEMNPEEFQVLKAFVKQNGKKKITILKKLRENKGLSITKQYIVKPKLPEDFADGFELLSAQIDISSNDLDQFLQSVSKKELYDNIASLKNTLTSLNAEFIDPESKITTKIIKSSSRVYSKNS